MRYDPAVPDEWRLVRLARAAGPLRRVLAAVAARLIETKAPERLCYARLSDYARERAGLSARQLQELARVHRALADLPGLERALLDGALPWSKVRLVARVARGEDEACWLARARAVATRRLEQEVREHVRGTDAETLDVDGPQRRVALRCTPALREKWSLVHELAERVAGQRLGAAEALELVVAEACSALPIDPACAVGCDAPARPARFAAESSAAEMSCVAGSVAAQPPGAAFALAGPASSGQPRGGADAAARGDEHAETTWGMQPGRRMPVGPGAVVDSSAPGSSTPGSSAPASSTEGSGAPASSSASSGRGGAPGAAQALALESSGSGWDPERDLPDAVVSLASGLDAADAFELDRRLRAAVRLEQTLDSHMAPLLRIVTSPEFEWGGDYQTLSRFAREQLGMAPSKARALLRLERAGDVCPELREAYRGGRLSWVKAQCLLPLLLLDVEGAWRPGWVDWACRVTLRRLEADVERALRLRAAHGRAWQRCKYAPETAQDPIPEDEQPMCAPDVDPEATEVLVFRLPVEVASLFVSLRETLRRRMARERARECEREREQAAERQRALERSDGAADSRFRAIPRFVTDGEVFEALLDAALRAWTLRDPEARRPDPVFEREGWRCAVPGCTSRRNLHDHHVTFRSAGGGDDPGNRVALCAFHHQRGVHAGRLGLRGRAPDALLFELGLRPGAPPLVRYRSGDIVVSSDELQRVARCRRAA